MHQALRVFLLALAAALAIGPASAAGSPKTGDPAPALSGQTLDGNTFDLASARGHVVVVNFWATWCPPCRAEMPALNAFYLRHQTDGVVLIGVSEDRPRDEADVRRAMNGLAYPALIARRAERNGFGELSSLPETVVIDASGVVRAVFAPTHGAPLTIDQLDAAVGPMLQRPPGG
jgi:peroxiredoxin